MADTNIDSLSIEVSARADNAAKSIETLVAALTKLKGPLDSVQGGLQTLTKSLGAVKSEGKQFSSAMGSVATEAKATGTAAQGSASKIEMLVSAFKGIQTNISSGLTPAVSGLTQMKSIASKVNSEIVKLKTGTEQLSPSKINSLDTTFSSMKSDIASVNTQLRQTRSLLSSVSGSKVIGSNLSLAQTAQAPLTASAVSSGMRSVPTLNAAPTISGLEKIKSTTSQVTSKMSELGTRIKKAASVGSKSTNLLGESFIQLRSSIFFALFGLTAVAGVLKTTLGNAVDYVETLNLFNVVFRKNTEGANSFVQAMSNAYGLDPARIMKYDATFYSIAESMGIAKTQATTLSETLTRLTFDVASLRNMSFDETFTKMQAILTGQDRAIRTLGGSIQATTLQETANSLGIKENVSAMTQAEKSLLRLIVYYRQSSVAQGDMSRTLLQPANLVRILGDQFSITARTIGSLFIPMIQKTLPYLIYFVKAVGEAAARLASFFHIDLKKLSGSTTSVKDVATNLGGVSDKATKADTSIKKATTSIKKMRDNVLGIDKLNILQKDTKTVTPATTGVADTAASDAKILDDLIKALQKELDQGLQMPFLDLMKKIGKQFADFKKKLSVTFAPFIKAMKEVWAVLKPFLGAVWKGFTDFWKNVLVPLGVWTMNHIGVWLLERFRDVLKWCNEHPMVAKIIGAILASFVALKGLDMGLGLLLWVTKVFLGAFKLKSIPGILKTVEKGIGAAMGIPGKLASLGGAFTSMAEAAGVSVWGAAGLVAASAAAGLAIGALINQIPAVKKFQQDVADWAVDVFGLGAGTAKLGDKLTAQGMSVDKYGNIVDKNGQKVTKATTNITSVEKENEASKKKLKEAQEKYQTSLDTFGKKAPQTVNALNRVRDAQKKTTKSGKDLSNSISSKKPVHELRNVRAAVVVTQKKLTGFNGFMQRLKTSWTKLFDSLRDAFSRFSSAIGVGGGFSVGGGGGIGGNGGGAYASGGFPNVGSMFLAGEAGPELIGSFGGNSNTVMPLANSDFVTAMSKAVYEATVAAGSQTKQSDQQMVINLDGYKVGVGTKKAMNRRGNNGIVVIN